MDCDEIEKLFTLAEARYGANDYGQIILDGIEKDLKAISDVPKERALEKKRLEQTLKSHKAKLNGMKNVKGRSDLNVRISARREKIRRKVEDIKDKLHTMEAEDAALKEQT